MISFTKRSQEKEIFDIENPGEEETFQAYREIQRVNRFLGGINVILSHLKRFAAKWPKNFPIKILDVGTGACDIPQAIVKWAKGKGYSVKIVALDISPRALAFAKKEIAGYPEIILIQASISQLPFRPQSFDYVISSLFFHHLEDGEIPRVLKSLDTVTRKGILVNDLLRRQRAYLWILFFCRFTQNRVFRNDAPLSVLRGFKRCEIEGLFRASNLDYLKFYEHFGHRFAMAGEKF